MSSMFVWGFSASGLFCVASFLSASLAVATCGGDDDDDDGSTFDSTELLRLAILRFGSTSDGDSTDASFELPDSIGKSVFKRFAGAIFDHYQQPNKNSKIEKNTDFSELEREGWNWADYIQKCLTFCDLLMCTNFDFH